MNRSTSILVILVSGAMLGAGLTPAAAAARAAPQPHGYAAAVPTRILDGAPGSAGKQRADGHVRPAATGENPPGRVSQTPGFAGYTMPVSDTTTAQVTVTLPTITCATGSNPGFGDVTSSDPVPGVELQEVQVQVFVNCHGGNETYGGWSTLDPRCNPEGCPVETFNGGIVSPGDQVQIQASVSPTGSSTAITDLTSGASLSWTSSDSVTSNIGASFSLTDYCFLPNGTGEACSADDPSSPVPPPGYGSYTPITFSSAEINGTGLGSYLSGPDSTGWAEFNSVWGPTLTGQTTYVNGGSSYSVTNANLTLPSVSLSSPSVDRPDTGTASLVFTATLSASSSYPVYLDYATQDGTAHAGQDYQAVSGTLHFPAGALNRTISVPVIPGSQTGGQVYFTVQLTNPSYAAAGTSAEGTIYEGPVVTSVSPSSVPLDGGPATTITVGGFDLSSAAGVQFCPTASEGGSCLSGTDVTVQSDNSLTVTAPDATNSVIDNSTTLTTDAIVTSSSGTPSPVSEPADELVFGCTQQRVTDGQFQAAGCLTDEQNGNDVTQQQSAIDGVNVSATPADDVTYATGASSVSSSGSVTVSLALLNRAIKVFTGQLTTSLSQPVSFTVPAGTKLAGFALSGTLTLTPTSLGVASGSVTVTLPGVLGGGTGTLSFTTTTGGGLSNLTVQVPSATFMQLFSLSGVTLAYTASSGTWNVTGTATTGGGTSTSFGGNLVYSGNTLTSASLDVGAISLAGLLNLSKLHVSYASGVWSGGATLTQGTQQATVSLTFNNNTGTLTAGELKTGPVSLFGAVQVNSFDLTYDGTNWNLNVTSTLSGGGTATAALKVANGIITSASLTLTNFSLLGKITISSATLAYSATAPNAQCATVTGAEIWCGSWAVSLPNATVVSGLGGTLAFASGAFASGSVTVNGNVALLDGVFLTQLGASLTVNPPPTTLSGSATITFGPQVSGTSVLSLKGTLTRVFQSGTTAGSYAVDGTVTALAGSSNSLTLGTANVTVSDSGTSTLKLTLGGSPSGLSISAGGATATITGVVKGTFTGSTFTITGSTSVTVPILGTLSGNLKADNTGIASCAKTSGGKQVGFEYYWSTGTLDVFDSKGCTERGF